MCKCNPTIRAPFCGNIGCEWPAKTSSFNKNAKPAIELDVNAVPPTQPNIELTPEMQGFITLMQQFEKATMERLVAVSRMQATKNETDVIRFKHANEKHEQAAGELLRAIKQVLDVVEGYEAMVTVVDDDDYVAGARCVTHDELDCQQCFGPGLAVDEALVDEHPRIVPSEDGEIH